MQIKIHVYAGLADAEPIQTVEFVGASEDDLNEKVMAWFESQGDQPVICDVEVIHDDAVRDITFIGR